MPASPLWTILWIVRAKPMSKESKRLRGGATDQLRQSRRAGGSLKTIHEARSAALKAMARHEEWLNVELDRSKPVSRKKR